MLSAAKHLNVTKAEVRSTGLFAPHLSFTFNFSLRLFNSLLIAADC